MKEIATSLKFAKNLLLDQSVDIMQMTTLSTHEVFLDGARGVPNTA